VVIIYVWRPQIRREERPSRKPEQSIERLSYTIKSAPPARALVANMSSAAGQSSWFTAASYIRPIIRSRGSKKNSNPSSELVMTAVLTVAKVFSS